MNLLDVNVVIAAYRPDDDRFATVRPWLDEVVRTGAPFAITDGVAASFIRIVTNGRVFADPEPIEDAFAFVRALRAQPGHQTIRPGPNHLDVFERVCIEGSATGDLVPDADLAALAIEHAAEVVSIDRDFARFPGLRWSVPGASIP